MTSTDGASRILIPLSSTEGLRPFLAFGRQSFGQSEEMVIVGIVVTSGDPGQDAHRARTMRRRLRQFVREGDLANARVLVRSAQSVAQGVRATVLEEQPGLVLLPWLDGGRQPDGIEELAARPPCDTAFVRLGREVRAKRILLAARGGPQAELAMDLALRLTRRLSAELTLMHIDRPSAEAAAREREHKLYRSLLSRCRRETRVRQRTVTTDDVPATILEEAVHHDVLVLGAGLTHAAEPPLGAVAETIARDADCTAIVVKTGTPVDPAFFSGPQTPIDVIVDRWFVDNTFHCREFGDIEALVAAKKRAGLRISLAVMAGQKRQALPGILETIGAELCERNPLLDEMLVFDRTGNLVEPPFGSEQFAESRPSQGGTAGLAMWNSLRQTTGDIVAWIDGDLRNVHPRMVYGVVGPLLTQERLQYVKGFYQRPAWSDDASFSQARTQLTELTARPLLNVFFPDLAGVVEPLSREHAIRRSAARTIRLFAGHGAEIGILIDVFQHFGLRAIAQSDLESRVGEEVSVSALTEQAFSVIRVILKRLGERQLGRAGSSQQAMKLILQHDERYRLELVEAVERELPEISSEVDIAAIE